MKKHICLLILTLCLIILSSNFVLAEEYGNFTYEISDNNGIIITGATDNTVAELIIPGEIDGKNVVAIEEFAFCDCSALTSVKIEEGIKEIGAAAFAGCARLATVDFADSIEIIGDTAFRSCSLGGDIILPSDLKEIAEQAFYNCENITGLEFPDGLERIGADAFYNCYKITEINIPAGVIEISDGAFSGCMGVNNITVASDNTNYICDEYGALYNKDKTILLQYPAASTSTSFVIPDSVCEIGSYAFCGAEYLTGELTVPEGVTFIPKYAFLGCARLSEIKLCGNITGIDEFAFFACYNITKTEIPDKVKYIGDAAFVKCLRLKEISLPEGLEYVGVQSFANCTSLTAVDMPESIKTIGMKAFYECTALTEIEIPDGITIVDEDLFYGCTALESVKIPDSVLFIADRAFSNCTALTEIVFGNNIEYIGEKVLDGCDSLEHIYYKGTEDEWSKVEKDADNSKLDSVICNTVLAPIGAVYEQPYTYTENGEEKTVPSGVAFATVFEQYGEYNLKEFGMLLTDKAYTTKDFNMEAKGVVKGKGETAPNMEGKFGIMFYGNGLSYGKTYYTISYAVYEDESGNEIIIYGNEITEFSPKGE